MAQAGRHRDVKKGEMLFASGDDNSLCATLISGALKISSHDSYGNERILSLVHPAGFVGELFAPMAHHDVTALTDSKLCVFSRGEYERMVSDFPDLALALLRRSSDDLYDARSLMDMSSRKSARARLAGLISNFADAASNSPCHPADRFELPLSRGEMAGMLGLTIETISRQLSQLEKDGVILRHGSRGIELTDAPRLSQLCD